MNSQIINMSLNRNSSKNMTQSNQINNKNNNNKNNNNIHQSNNMTQNNINRKKYNINNKIGIMDPNGNKENPLTGEPYTDLEAYKEKSEKWRHYKVYEKRNEILQAIKENNIVIAKSGTGSGKTVLLPKLMMHALGYSKPVICTVPKKTVALKAAEWAALCLDVNLGEHVGYYYKGKRKLNENGIKS